MKRAERVLTAVAVMALLGACGSTTTTVRTTVVPIGPTAFATIPPVQPTNPADVTTLPPDAYGEEQTYTVKSGDAPIKVAEAYGVSLADLIAYNGWISASEFPLPGTEIKIPPNATKLADEEGLAPVRDVGWFIRPAIVDIWLFLSDVRVTLFEGLWILIVVMRIIDIRFLYAVGIATRIENRPAGIEQLGRKEHPACDIIQLDESIPRDLEGFI